MRYFNKIKKYFFDCESCTVIPKDNTEPPVFEPIVDYDETYIIEIGTSSGDIEMQSVSNSFSQRGRLLRTTFGYQPNGFVKREHSSGHNGKNKGLCLMRVPGNPYDDQYTDVLLKKTIAEPHFCYGHIQMLYNCTFIEGGN